MISDALAAAQVTLNAIQASADAFPPLKSAASAAIVFLEMSKVSFQVQHTSRLLTSTPQKLKSNKKGCNHIAERSAQLVQDIWRQAKDFGIALPAEVKESVVQIEKHVPALSNCGFEY
jgi:Zn-dependent oligopeptidase